MLYLEESGLRPPGHEGRLVGRCSETDPHKLQPQPCLWGNLELSAAAGRPAMAGAFSGQCRDDGFVPPPRAGGMCSTSGCSQQEKSECPDAHHLQ